MKLNLHIYPTAIRYETRLFKETGSLVRAGLAERVIVCGIQGEGLPERETLDDSREIWRVPLRFAARRGFPAKVLSQLEWSIRIFAKFRGNQVALINAHSISVLPLAVVLKILHGGKLVYDTHELETEKVGMRGARKRLAKLAERFLMRWVDSVIVVSESIGRWYRDAYSISSVHLVRNVPDSRTMARPDGRTGLLRNRFGIADDQVLFIYQGILAPERGLELLLEAFSKTSGGQQVVFMGFGPLEGVIREYARRHSNIHLHPAVPASEILSYTMDADIGIVLFENTCLNYYYCLPNKFFEYLMSGVPVLVSDFPDMGQIVDAYDCGWKVSVDLKAVSDSIERLTLAEVRKKRIGTQRCKNAFDWVNEERALIHAYGHLGSAAAP